MWHIIDCAIVYLQVPSHFILTAIAILVAIYTFIQLRADIVPRQKVLLIFTHITSIFFPIVLFSFRMSCELFNHICSMTLFNAIVYSIPVVFMLSAGFTFVALPVLYIKSDKTFKNTDRRLSGLIVNTCSRYQIKRPGLFFIDMAKPVAFSFASLFPAIFMSVGMYETLSLKEKEAVILHELGHIKSNSSFFKTSTILARIFSPFFMFKGFASDLTQDESDADAFAIDLQGTDRYIISAKRKIEAFFP